MTLRQMHSRLGELISECDRSAGKPAERNKAEYPDLPAWIMTPASKTLHDAYPVEVTGLHVERLVPAGEEGIPFRAFILDIPPAAKPLKVRR